MLLRLGTSEFCSKLSSELPFRISGMGRPATSKNVGKISLSSVTSSLTVPR